jgi:hypothetical protein
MARKWDQKLFVIFYMNINRYSRFTDISMNLLKSAESGMQNWAIQFASSQGK